MQTGLRHVIKAMRGYQNQGVRREHERQYSRSVYRSRGRSSSSAYLTYWTIKLPRPSLIVTGAVIGSGELVLTTSLGAVAGWSLLWWLVLSCWCKSLVQAELARYTIVSGDTYLRAINRLPGRIWRISWPIWLGLIAYIQEPSDSAVYLEVQEKRCLFFYLTWTLS